MRGFQERTENSGRFFVKKCCACGLTQAASCFNRCQKALDGLQAMCRGCQKNYRETNKAWMPAYRAAHRLRHPESDAQKARKYRDAHPDKVRRASLLSYHKKKEQSPEEVYLKRRDAGMRRLYGISIDEYNEMLSQQNGVCAVCGQPETGRKGYLHIDHDHDTGQVRGLLCQGCNIALGLVGETVEGLMALVAYLEQHEAKEKAA